MIPDIRPMEALSKLDQEKAAEILMTALAHVPSAWHDLESAQSVVRRALEDPERFALAALVEDEPVGWIGAICHSEAQWELHPLAVAPNWQGQGIGRRLVAALEERARDAGVTTLWLGTDDGFGGTNLDGRELYPDVLGELAKLAPAAGHPYRFYEKQGFAVVGAIPDAGGPGRHDILMAKRIVT